MTIGCRRGGGRARRRAPYQDKGRYGYRSCRLKRDQVPTSKLDCGRVHAAQSSQGLLRSPKPEPESGESIRGKRRKHGLCGRCCVGFSAQSQLGDTAARQVTGENSFRFPVRHLPPLEGSVDRQRPFHPLPYDASGVENLTPQSFLIERSLNAMQVLNFFRHSMGGSGASCADLQDASVCLYVKGENMAA